MLDVRHPWRNQGRGLLFFAKLGRALSKIARRELGLVWRRRRLVVGQVTRVVHGTRETRCLRGCDRLGGGGKASSRVPGRGGQIPNRRLGTHIKKRNSRFLLRQLADQLSKRHRGRPGRVGTARDSPSGAGAVTPDVHRRARRCAGHARGDDRIFRF